MNPHNYNNKRTEHTISKQNTCFRCESEDHFIANFSKTDTPEKKVHWNTENSKTCAYISTKIDKTPDNSKHQNDSHKIYASMTHMTSNAEILRIYFGDSLQQTNWILDSGATCHMTP